MLRSSCCAAHATCFTALFSSHLQVCLVLGVAVATLAIEPVKHLACFALAFGLCRNQRSEVHATAMINSVILLTAHIAEGARNVAPFCGTQHNGITTPGSIDAEYMDITCSVPGDTIATIDFLAKGGDQYPYRGAPFTILGLTYQQALADYIVNGLGGVISAADYPEGGEGRSIKLP